MIANTREAARVTICSHWRTVVAAIWLVGACQGERVETVLADPAPTARSGHEKVAESSIELSRFRIDRFPTGETYASLQLVRLLPDAELAEPPIDGPRLVSVIAGAVTLRTELGGALAIGDHGADAEPRTIPSRSAFVLEAGETALIPAGVPAIVANPLPATAEYIQAQLETPPTVCPCGTDLSGVQRVLLASETLSEGFQAGSLLVLSNVRLNSGGALSLPRGVVLQLVGATDGPVLERRADGTVANNGAYPAELYRLTISTDGVPTL